MCGIAGTVGTQDRTVVIKMMDALRHRGPDGVNYCWRDRAHIGAARLSIIDPSSGPQPVYNETGHICIAFNGEIYNHHDLRAELKKKGHLFTTKTDTEVVLHLYEEFGEACVQHVHGMFAFAILDGKRLLLGRDRLGIKPLYYTFLPQEQLFIFASEIKGILQCPEYTPQLDMQAFADSVALGHLVGTETFFEGVKSLAAGHTMSICWNEQIHISEQKPYFTCNFLRDEGISQADALDSLETVLRNAVASHLAADVDVGLTLSGGLDSTVLALLSRECQSRPALTFTVADDERHPDILQAQFVARTVGLPHFPVIMTFDDYLAAIPDCVVAKEQPYSMYGLPFYILCQQMRHHVKTCIDGEGADELFGGYPEYLDQQYRLARIYRRLPLLKQLGILPSPQAIDVIERLSPSPSFDKYLQNTFALNLGDPLERNHLDPLDKLAMSASVEMRVPYLDDHVLALVNCFPLRYLVRKDLGIKKYLLRHLCLKRFGDEMIDVVLRKKVSAPFAGFQLLERFDNLCNETLPGDYLARHALGHCFERKQQLLLFELFYEIFIVHRGDCETIGSIQDFLKSRQR